MIFGANLSDVKIQASAQEGKILFQRIIQVSISKCETTVFLSPVLSGLCGSQFVCPAICQMTYVFRFQN